MLYSYGITVICRHKQLLVYESIKLKLLKLLFADSVSNPAKLLPGRIAKTAQVTRVDLSMSTELPKEQVNQS